MKSLPAPLASWAATLAPLGDETRALLGRWLPRLDSLLGVETRDQPDHAGEPDGLSGLGRHGRYERLALSEWALLDVAPEEFLRRTGSGEHLFHQIARVDRAGERRLVALFDAGPMQLGAPRLAHLAWLLVLARRAARQGARLAWGILQDPSRGLREGADADDLRTLLGCRSVSAATERDRADWSTRLGAPRAAEERWLVAGGADRTWESALAARTLSVVEPDQPSEAVLGIEVHHPGGGRSRASLPLPAGEVCGRLLRDPFAAERRPGFGTESLALGAQVRFDDTGTHLLMRMQSGEIVALLVPVRKGEEVRVAARYRPVSDESVVAAGWRKGKLYVATVHDKGVRVHQGGRDRRWVTHDRAVMGSAPLPRPSPVVLLGLSVDPQTKAFWFGDAGWRLYHGFIDGGFVFAVPETVLGWRWARDRVVTVGRVGSGPLEVFVHRRNGLDRVVLQAQASRASEAHLAVDASGRALMVATSPGDGVWQLHSLDPPASVHRMVPEGSTLFSLGGRDGTSLCVFSEENVWMRGEWERNHLGLRFPGSIEHATLSPDGRLVAVQVGGELHLSDWQGRRRLSWGRSRT